MSWREAEREFADAAAGETTLGWTFADVAERHADGVAQRYKGGIYDRSLVPSVVPAAPDGEFAMLTYREMGTVVGNLAAGFRDLGVAPGDRVGLLAETRMEWAQCDFALLAAGAVVTPVYPSASTEQVGFVLGDASVTGVVVENADALDRVRAAVDGPDADVDLGFAVVIDDLPDDGLADGDGPPACTLADLHDRGAERFDPGEYEGWLDARSPDDLATLIYTSGTTGRPKGVRLTHANLAANVDQCRRRFGPRPDRTGPVVDADTRAVSFLPLAHVFERLAGHFLLFASGASVAYAESPDTIREDFALVRPTIGTSVPRVYERVFRAARERAADSPIGERVFRWAVDVGTACGHADRPGALLRAKHRLADALVFGAVREALGGEIEFLISGGGSLSPDLCALYHGMGLPVYEGYGLTETSPVVAVNPPEAPRIGTVGPPVVDVDVRLDGDPVDADAFPDAEGEVGELLVRGPNVTDGYWNAPAATARAFTDGWFRTGDVVERDPDGYLRFRERLKELLVLSTGKNVAPGPVEDAFAAAEYVEQCVVLGDDRPFVTALVVPDLAAVRDWAERADVDLPPDDPGICRDDRVRGLIDDEIGAVNADLESHETIKRFRLVPDEFTVENDLLTPTLKKKRRRIRDRYAAEIEAMYEGTGGA